MQAVVRACVCVRSCVCACVCDCIHKGRAKLSRGWKDGEGREKEQLAKQTGIG